ncbi:response regulator transcription factor [Sphingomonas sp. MMS12-HWE2-04]|uniref:response regulator transcription factor n=1 Tax=Sphingomonas sp. MMS12-HWE2-04 TaxID=3234199 RepID=UPI00384B5D6C
MSETPLISVVDDDEDVRLALEALIDSLGLQVRTFASADAFLASGTLFESSCVISDIHMPGMSGLELALTLGTVPDAPPIVLISAFATDDIRRRAAEAGAACFLSKPLDPARLVAQLESALDTPL